MILGPTRDRKIVKDVKKCDFNTCDSPGNLSGTRAMNVISLDYRLGHGVCCVQTDVAGKRFYPEAKWKTDKDK